MSLSEAEITARLASLRRQREDLDRAIADLLLYQELGRRLGAGDPNPPADDRRAVRGAVRDPGPVSDPAARPPSGIGPPGTGGLQRPEWGAPRPDRAGAARSRRRLEPDPEPDSGPVAEAGPGRVPPPVAFAEDAAGSRRYGRAMMQAACAAIAGAGRPLHAAEILEVLLDQGFTLPGRDPVAALNTRLWKRAGPGGPLRRVGEAVYALSGTASPQPARGLP
jgi:hypothetical protein